MAWTGAFWKEKDADSDLAGVGVDATSLARDQVNTQASSQISPVPVETAVKPSPADDEKVQMIWEAIISRPSAYTQFLDAFNSLKGVPGIDDNARFRAALAFLKNVKPDQIAGAIQLHENYLNDQKDTFKKARQEGLAVVQEKETRRSSLNGQISALQVQIQGLREEVAELSREIASDAAKVQSGEQSFNAACHVVSQRLSADRQRLGEFKA